ncbi:MAG: tetratricopeptide repeat protein [Ignavibacteria bacterium]|nr:tetratricopeptide repeat protein [Ignavibacteria bacterium]
MTNVLQFTPRPPSKFGFERVRKRKKGPAGKRGQLNLFSGGGAQVLRLPSDISPFEEALLLDERDDERAESAYRQAIEEQDSVADAYCNLGILQSRSGKTAQAFDSFTKALEHSPRHFEAHFNLANLYFDSGDLKLARLHYEMGLEVDPEFANLYFNLGLVLASLGDLRPASEAFRKYRQLAPPEEASKADNLLESINRSLNTR